MCPKDELTAEEKFLQIEKRIFKLKIAEIIFVVIFAIVMLGSLIFIIGLQFKNGNPTYQLAAEIVNTYTGIILGFVAMTVSLLSMILGFHNTRQAERSNLDSVKEFTKLSSTTNEIRSLEKELCDKINAVNSDLDKLSELKEIKEKLSSLATQLQDDIDKHKGSGTPGTAPVQVGDYSQETDKDEFDDVKS